jgi:hypothetical protein
LYGNCSHASILECDLKGSLWKNYMLQYIQNGYKQVQKQIKLKKTEYIIANLLNNV